MSQTTYKACKTPSRQQTTGDSMQNKGKRRRRKEERITIYGTEAEET
jgi:hypothetical protein